MLNLESTIIQFHYDGDGGRHEHKGLIVGEQTKPDNVHVGDSLLLLSQIHWAGTIPMPYERSLVIYAVDANGGLTATSDVEIPMGAKVDVFCPGKLENHKTPPKIS